VEAAELVNFGAFIGFMSVNLCVIRHYFFRRRHRSGKQILMNLAHPALGLGICFYIWLHLSHLALMLGALWMVLGFFYLLFLTRGFSRKLTELRLGTGVAGL
jgi:hypothetical protein